MKEKLILEISSYMSGTVLVTLYMRTHLILRTIL